MIEAVERPQSAHEFHDGRRDAEVVLAEHLNGLLAQWHAWSSDHAMVNGYPSINSTCRQSRSSRQYDDANGGLDAHIDHVLMEAVDSVVDAISEPWRTALAVQARSLATGAAVWSSPRLPVCREARAALLVVARKKFNDGLAKRNLM